MEHWSWPGWRTEFPSIRKSPTCNFSPLKYLNYSTLKKWRHDVRILWWFKVVSRVRVLVMKSGPIRWMYRSGWGINSIYIAKESLTIKLKYYSVWGSVCFSVCDHLFVCMGMDCVCESTPPVHAPGCTHCALHSSWLIIPVRWHLGIHFKQSGLDSARPLLQTRGKMMLHLSSCYSVG